MTNFIFHKLVKNLNIKSLRASFSTYQSILLNSMIDETYVKDPEEFEVKVSYGHIAAKLWNNDGKGLPILAIHGWLDNAGTWDRLAPLIDPNHPIVAIDVPGHGVSSHYPNGAGGYFTDNLTTIERVVQNFKWKEFILLGHSMGGGACMLYAGTFPERIKKLIMLDILKPMSVDAEDQPTITAKYLTEVLKTEKKLQSEPPSYDYDDLVQKLVTTYHGSVTEESVKILLKRGAKRNADGKYSLRYSPMLRIPSGLSMTFDQQKVFGSNVTCDTLLVKSALAPIYSSKEQNEEFLNILKKSCKSFRFEVAEGTHHLHLNNPAPVAELINDFLHDVPQSKENQELAEQYLFKEL